MTRDELTQALSDYLDDNEFNTAWDRALAIRNFVEPLIRADERRYSRTAAGVRRDYEARWVDLRAKVEALRFTKSGGYGDALRDVLALFDGGSDG